MEHAIIKGQNIILTNDLNQTADISISIKWQTKESAHSDLDIDASLFLVGKNGKVRKDQDFIFYNNGMDDDRCVIHMSDQGSQKSNEVFIVHLAKIPDDVDKLIFNLTLHDWEHHHETLGGVIKAALLRITDRKTKSTITEYDLRDDLDQETAMMLGEVYRHGAGWKFRAIGQGFAGGLIALAQHFGVTIGEDKEELQEAESIETTETKRTRRSPQEVMAEQKTHLRAGLQMLMPQIVHALDTRQNESNTRMILDRILQDALGYHMEEIKSEQNIQGRRADYVLSVGGKDVLVIEVKKIGMVLRERQVFQATSYGAYSGIKWALLTNVVCWQLYRITTCERVDAELVFEANIKNGLDDDALDKLYALSRYGIKRKGLLEQIWVKASALSPASVIRAILNEEVITKIRTIINKERDSQLSNQEVQEAVERLITQTE